MNQAEYNAQLQQIVDNANALVKIGVPIENIDAYSTAEFADLGAGPQTPSTSDKLLSLGARVLSGVGVGMTTGSIPGGIAGGITTASSATPDTLKSITGWSMTRVAVVFFGLILVIAGVVTVASKDAVNVIASNPEILAGA